jgi:hypothetical protein
MAVRIAFATFDCADAHRVARFWSAAVGRPLDPQGSARFACIGTAGRRDTVGCGPSGRDDNPTWMFAKAPEPKVAKYRMRLDLMAPDPEAEVLALSSWAAFGSRSGKSTDTRGRSTSSVSPGPGERWRGPEPGGKRPRSGTRHSSRWASLARWPADSNRRPEVLSLSSDRAIGGDSAGHGCSSPHAQDPSGRRPARLGPGYPETGFLLLEAAPQRPLAEPR